MNAPRATATGTLHQTPLAELLVYVLDRRLSGSLVLEAADETRSAIVFSSGVPVRVRTAQPVAPLGERLVEHHGVSAAQVEQALLAGGPLGEALVKLGALDDSNLASSLSEHFSEKLAWLAALGPRTAWGFYDSVDYLKDWGGAPPAVEPLALIWRLARDTVDVARVEATIARVGTGELRLHKGARISRFGFDAGVKPALDVLRAKPQSYGFLADSGLADVNLLSRTIYVLSVTRHLESPSGQPPVGVDLTTTPASDAPRSPIAVRRAGSTSRPNAGSGGATTTGRHTAPAPPTSSEPSTESDAAFAEEVRKMTSEMGSKNYYELIGVDRKADAAAIQTAFFQLAKVWHPDKLTSGREEHREAVTRIFSKLSEAHQTLSGDEQRAEYNRLMKEGGATGDEQETIQKVLKAATAFQKAEVFLRRGSLAQAEAEAAAAVQADPEQAEYLALLAWIRSQMPGAVEKGYDELIRMLDKAHKMQSENARIRYYRGKVHKRAGNGKLAMRDFRQVVEADPKNVDAARELRLFQMRAPEGDKRGLFGKLFKR